MGHRIRISAAGRAQDFALRVPLLQHLGDHLLVEGIAAEEGPEPVVDRFLLVGARAPADVQRRRAGQDLAVEVGSQVQIDVADPRDLGPGVRVDGR